MENKYVANEQGVCPVCGARKLCWGDSDMQGDYLGYEWECEECHAQGTEWYKLVFDGHEVVTKGDTADQENLTTSVNDYILPNV